MWREEEEDVRDRNNNDVGVIGEERGIDRKDEGSGDMDDDICDDVITEEGDEEDRGVRGVI